MPKSNAVRKDDETKTLSVKWKDGTTSVLAWKTLRDNCPCAECAELHGPADPLRLKIAPNYHLEGVEYIGNYAIQLRWGYGHSAGIYSWNHLRNLAGLMAAPQ